MNGKKEESKNEETRKGSVNSFTRVPKLPNFKTRWKYSSVY